MYKLLVILSLPLLTGCSLFASKKYQFRNPQTNEPMANLSLTASYGGLMTPISPFIVTLSKCKTDSNGIANIRGLSTNKGVVISVDLNREKKYQGESLYLDRFRNAEMDLGDVIRKTEFAVERIK